MNDHSRSETEQAKHIPPGMRRVSREEFMRRLMDNSRLGIDIMPRPVKTGDRRETHWEINHTRVPWGWSSEGWYPMVEGATQKVWALVDLKKGGT